MHLTGSCVKFLLRGDHADLLTIILHYQPILQMGSVEYHPYQKRQRSNGRHIVKDGDHQPVLAPQISVGAFEQGCRKMLLPLVAGCPHILLYPVCIAHLDPHRLHQCMLQLPQGNNQPSAHVQNSSAQQ